MKTDENPEVFNIFRILQISNENNNQQDPKSIKKTENGKIAAISRSETSLITDKQESILISK